MVKCFDKSHHLFNLHIEIFIIKDIVQEKLREI